jgi:CRP/FNR family transcriptional regulator
MPDSRRATLEDLQRAPLLRRLGAEDRERLAEVAQLRRWPRGSFVFHEGDPSDHFLVLVEGRVKVFKVTPAGRHLILEIFGPGDPLGSVAVYAERAFPATAEVLEDAEAVAIPRADFFALLDSRPSLVRGLLMALTHRLVELTTRLAELTGGRVESRIARLLLKLADDLGRPGDGGTFIPLSLSRQELADLIGTTIETCIRVMSRLGKEGVVRTDRDGFTVLDRQALEALAAE